MKTTAEKIAVMQAYEEGKVIKQIDRTDRLNQDRKLRTSKNMSFCKKEIQGIEWLDVEWDWVRYDFDVFQEPKQVPFDFSDEETLFGRKVKNKANVGTSLIYSVYYNSVVCFGRSVSYEELSENFEIWNISLNRWESCTKTVNN